MTHPRLIPAERLTEVDYTRTDTLFVVLLIAAVVFCALIPFALL